MRPKSAFRVSHRGAPPAAGQLRLKLGGLLRRRLYEGILLDPRVDKIATEVDQDERVAYHRSQFDQRR